MQFLPHKYFPLVGFSARFCHMRVWVHPLNIAIVRIPPAQTCIFGQLNWNIGWLVGSRGRMYVTPSMLLSWRASGDAGTNVGHWMGVSSNNHVRHAAGVPKDFGCRGRCYNQFFWFTRTVGYLQCSGDVIHLRSCFGAWGRGKATFRGY